MFKSRAISFIFKRMLQKILANYWVEEGCSLPAAPLPLPRGLRVNELVRELAEQEKRGPEIFPQLYMVGWSKKERLSFQNDWNDDSFLVGLEESTTLDVLPAA